MEEILKPTSSDRLEQSLSEKIEALYRTQLGHEPSKVTCKFVDEKIAIFVEDSITQPEQVLADSGKENVAEQLRSNINQQMRAQLKTLIEEVVKIPVIDMQMNSAIATGRTSTIAVLATPPNVQDSSALLEVKQQTGLDGDSGAP